MTDIGLRGYFSVLVCLSALLGCSAGTRVPEDSFYRLEVGAPESVREKAALDGVLLVEVVAAAPIYRDRSFLFSDNASPQRLQRHHYRHWVDSPPNLLEHGLAKYLSAARMATLVVTPDERIDHRYRLRLSLERFEHIRDQGNGAVVIEAKQMLTKRDVKLPLQHDRLTAKSIVQGSDFPAVVAAYRNCVESLYAQVQSALVQSE